MKKVIFSLLFLVSFAAANTCTQAYFLAIKPYLTLSKNLPYVDSVRSRYDYTMQDDTVQIDKFKKYIYIDGRLEKMAFGYVGDTANQYTDYTTFHWSTDESMLSNKGEEELISETTLNDTTIISKKAYYAGELYQTSQYKVIDSYISFANIDYEENDEFFAEVFFRNDSIIEKTTSNKSTEESFTYYVEDPDEDFKCYEYVNDSLTTILVYQKTEKGFSVKLTQGTHLNEIFFVNPENPTTAIRKRHAPVKISPKARYFDLLGRYKYSK